jgi:hypothetical protein
MSSAKFFVSTSDKEGFGMAIAEAINLGAVPIVTLVGEPSKYLDAKSAFFFDTNGELDFLSKQKILDSLQDRDNLKLMNKRAQRQLSAYGNYTDEMIRAFKFLGEI